MRKEPSKYTILVVDDQELLRKLIDTFLSKLGHSCVMAIDGVDALEKMKENKIDAVVTDLRMPNMDGIALTSKISIQYPEIPVMIMTAFDEGDTGGLAITAGARDFIKKPFSLNEFSVRLHKMINDSEAQKRMRREKGVDQDIEESINELEPPEQMNGEEDVDQDIQESIDVDKFIQEFLNELESSKQIKREKGVDQDIEESINELEPPKQMKGEKNADKFIQEFLNELESSKQIKREKGVRDAMREALDQLEASLKKIWNPPKNT